MKMDKRTLLAFFKPISSPKSGFLSTPEGKNLETLEKPVPEPSCSILNTGNPVPSESSGSIRNTENPDSEPSGSIRNTGNPVSGDAGTESSDLQTKNQEPVVQDVPEPGTKGKVQNQSNEKESSVETEGKDQQNKDQESKKMNDNSLPKRKRKKEDVEEDQEMRKKVKKSTDTSTSESPGLKQNSIQHFFKKMTSSDSPGSPKSTKTPKSSGDARPDPSTPVSSRLFNKKRKRVRVIESDSDSDISLDFNDVENLVTDNTPENTVGTTDTLDKSVEQHVKPSNQVEDKKSVKPVQNSPIASGSPGVRNAFTMMMKRKETPQPVLDETSKPLEENKKITSEQTESKEKPNNTAEKEEKLNALETPEVNLGTDENKFIATKDVNEEVEVKEESIGIKQSLESTRKVDTDSYEPIKVLLETPTRKFKDARLKNMLSVLSSIKSDDEHEDVEMIELDFTPKSKKKTRRKGQERRRREGKEEDPEREGLEESGSKEFELGEDKENLKAGFKPMKTGVHKVTCKGQEGEFDFSKYISGGVGACVLYQNQWLTPNQFEKLAGSRSKKYKQSLYIDKKPLIELLGSASSSNNTSGRTSPFGLNVVNNAVSLRAAARKAKSQRIKSDKPENALTTTKLKSKSSKSPNIIFSKIDHSKEEEAKNVKDKNVPGLSRKESAVKSQATEEVDETSSHGANKDTTETEETPGNSRRSGRIARNQDKMEEKKKEQDELEKKLMELEKKESARKKLGKLVPLNKIVEKDEEECINLGSDSESSSDDEIPKPKKKKETAGKLASIFLGKQKVVLPKEDPEKVAARRAFLLSSAPEPLRTQLKETAVLESGNILQLEFPKESHVQQIDSNPLWNTRLLLAGVKPRIPGDLKVRDLNSFCGEFLDKSSSKKPNLESRVSKLAVSDIRKLVGLLKRRVEYPVNRIFRRMIERKLQDQATQRNRTENKEGEKEEEKRGGKKPKRKSKELNLDAEWSIDQPSGELWTNKYKPRCSEDMILNEDETRKLRNWLNSWTKHGSSSQSSSATSDSDVEGERIVESSCALLTGRSGCGKTAAVYALAEELGLHVLEVNASTCRTGKQVTSMLLEATQSQQVQAGQSRLNFFKPAAAQGTPTPAVPAQNKGKRALILFEDIDIVFEEQDRGFYSAVNSIAAATKRPIIFTSSDDQCLNLINKSIKSRIQLFRFESAMNPSLVATHLQLMCLAEGVFVSHSSLEGVVSSSRSIRECIHTTQYMVESGYIQEIKSEIEDEEEIVKKPKKKFTLKKRFDDGPGEGSEPQHQDEEELYLKFFQTKSTRGSNVHEYALEVDIGSEYSHQQFMDLLAEKVEYTFISRKEVYPLDDTDEIKNIPGMIEVLRRNQAISFDPQLYDTEEDKKTEDETKPVQEKSSPSLGLDKETLMRRRKEMDSLSRHINTVAEFSHSINQFQDIDIFHQIVDYSSESTQQCLDIQPHLLASSQPHPTSQIQDLENEVLERTLTVQLIDDTARMDVLSGLRNILRSEDCRRLLCREGKRGGRFYHYLAKYGVHLSKPTSTALCNSL